MAEKFHAIRQIFNGTRAMNDRVKYRTMAFLLSFVHFTFMLLFIFLNINILFYYNAAIVVFYIVIAILLDSAKRQGTIFICVFIEILLHSILASLLLGWDWGFMSYVVALIPAAFYLSYTLPYFKGGMEAPVLSSLIIMVSYYTVQMLLRYVSPFLYPLDVPARYVRYFNYYNSFLTFVLLWVCSILFALEVRYMQNHMENENRYLGEAANYDPLTHLLNRRSMGPHLKKAMEDDLEFCVIMADIDNFKSVNDTYGHSFGDEVLMRIAEIITGDVREEDSVCRWGGEEILVLLKANKQISCQVAQRICEDVAGSVITYNNNSLSVTMTLGVAEYKKGETIREIIERADERLYYGKNNGKNQVVS